MKKLSKKQKEEIIKKYGKVPSKEEIFEKLRKSQEKLVVSLALAWESAPDDPKIRKDLLNAMEEAVKLRDGIYKGFMKEEPPDIRKSYEKLKDILRREASSD